MADENVNISKGGLKNTLMCVCRVQSSTEKEFILVDLTVEKFSHLKYNTEYRTDICELNMIVYIFRKRRAVTVSVLTGGVITGDHKIIECYVNYGNDEFSCPIHPKQLTNLVFDFDLPCDVFNISKNRPLERGQLCLVLKSEPVKTHVQGVLPLIRTKSYTEDDMIFSRRSARLKNLQESGKLVINKHLKEHFVSTAPWDFVIKISDGAVINVHKSILAARSKFFFNFLHKNEKKEIFLPGVTQRGLFSVVRFLYMGEIRAGDTDLMLEILALAIQLEIQSLKNLCLNYVKGTIDSKNVEKIRSAGEIMGLEILVEACNNIPTLNLPPPGEIIECTQQ